MLPNIWALHEIRRKYKCTMKHMASWKSGTPWKSLCTTPQSSKSEILLLRSSNFRFPFQIYEFVLNALDTPFLLLVLWEIWCCMFLRKPEFPYISGDLSSPSHTVHPLQRTSRQLLHFVALQEMKQDKRNHFQIIRSPVYNESEACSPRLITIASPGYYGITWSLIPS